MAEVGGLIGLSLTIIILLISAVFFFPELGKITGQPFAIYQLLSLVMAIALVVYTILDMARR